MQNLLDFPSSSLERPTFAESTRFWWKLGWISFGGTAAHIALMHDDLVEKKRWVANDAFLHALSLCMLLPGPEAQQLATYLGWKLHGRMGGIVAGVLFILPSTFVLLVLSLVYVRFGSLPWVTAMFGGLKPGVIALVLLALSRVAGRALDTLLQRGVCLGAFIALTFLHLSLPILMLLVIIFGLLVAWKHPAARSREVRNHAVVSSVQSWGQALRRVARVFAVGFSIWLLPLVALRLFCPDAPFWTQLCLFFTRTAFVTVGGSYTVIPYVAHLAVSQFHWLGQAQMVDGFALAETTPGPLIIVVAFVGFMAGFNHFNQSILLGVLALLVTTFYTFLPCFLFVFAGAPFVEKTYGNPRIETTLRLITALVLAAMLDLTVFLIHGVLFPEGLLTPQGFDFIAAGWIVISFLLLRKLRMNVGMVIALSLLFGVTRWSLGFV